MLATDRLWTDPEGCRWKVSTEYAADSSLETFDAPFFFSWAREDGETGAFVTPAHATSDLHELSDSDLRMLWSRFGR